MLSPSPAPTSVPASTPGDPLTLTATLHYRKPRYLLTGPAGAVEWAGTHPNDLRLHHPQCPWGPQPDLHADPDAYVDEGMACVHVEGGRCWPVVVPLPDPAAAVLLAGEVTAARPLLERWYCQLQPARPGVDAHASVTDDY
jgi:hypothetical protein